jgi:hypothetical protein
MEKKYKASILVLLICILLFGFSEYVISFYSMEYISQYKVFSFEIIYSIFLKPVLICAVAFLSFKIIVNRISFITPLVIIRNICIILLIILLSYFFLGISYLLLNQHNFYIFFTVKSIYQFYFVFAIFGTLLSLYLKAGKGN